MWKNKRTGEIGYIKKIFCLYKGEVEFVTSSTTKKVKLSNLEKLNPYLYVR